MIRFLDEEVKKLAITAIFAEMSIHGPEWE
jgi:hypothetical protein